MLTAEHPVVDVEEVASPCAPPCRRKMQGSTDSRAFKAIALFIVGAIVLRAIISALVPLLPDETYYWEWSRRLQGGYFDHPPGVALLIAAGTALFGETTLGVRFGPAVAAVVLHISLVILAGRLAGTKAAVRAAALGAVLPFAIIGLVLATPDAALLAATGLSLVFLERALSSPIGSRKSLGWWALTGVGLGLAFVSKFTAVLLPMSLVIACLAYQPLRARFAEPGPYVASAIALLLFAPVVMWNAGMDWVSFRFQLNHGFAGVAHGTPIGRELEMIGGQLGLATPILGVLLLIAIVVTLRNEWRLREYTSHTSKSAVRFALATIALTPFVFFAFSAWKRPIEPNWPAVAYASAVVLLASSRARWAESRWFKRGMVFAGVVLFAALLQVWKPLIPIAPRRDPIARAHGWESLANAVERARYDAFLAGTETRWVAAERYQDASELAFNLPDQPKVFSLNLGGRANQYDLWDSADQHLRADDALVVAFDANTVGDSLAGVVGKWFDAKQQGETVQLRRESGVIGERRIWMFRGARHVPARAEVAP